MSADTLSAMGWLEEWTQAHDVDVTIARVSKWLPSAAPVNPSEWAVLLERQHLPDVIGTGQTLTEALLDARLRVR